MYLQAAESQFMIHSKAFVDDMYCIWDSFTFSTSYFNKLLRQACLNVFSMEAIRVCIRVGVLTMTKLYITKSVFE